MIKIMKQVDASRDEWVKLTEKAFYPPSPSHTHLLPVSKTFANELLLSARTPLR